MNGLRNCWFGEEVRRTAEHQGLPVWRPVWIRLGTFPVQDWLRFASLRRNDVDLPGPSRRPSHEGDPRAIRRPPLQQEPQGRLRQLEPLAAVYSAAPQSRPRAAV